MPEEIQKNQAVTESQAVTETLEALSKAKKIEDIKGRERLVEAQWHLVELLNYLEKREGYSLNATVRKKCQLVREPAASPVKLRTRRVRPEATAGSSS